MHFKRFYTIIYFSLFLCNIQAAQNFEKLLEQRLPSVIEFMSKAFNIKERNLVEKIDNLAFRKFVDNEDLHVVQYIFVGNKLYYKKYGLNTEGISINFNKKIVIIIHGFNTNATVDWIRKLALAYKERDLLSNTIAIDWSKKAVNVDYFTSIKYLKAIGNLIAHWLWEKLLLQNEPQLKNVHLIGHSLGAHIAGFVGSAIFNKTGTLIGRISGLDVSSPFFEFPVKHPNYGILDKSDADFVDVYHTSVVFTGFFSPIGHQDFYINYGFPIQPGCRKESIIDSIICSHGSVTTVFRKSINSKDYLAAKCETALRAFFHSCDSHDVVIMGDNNNGTYIDGSFYLNTDSNGNPLR